MRKYATAASKQFFGNSTGYFAIEALAGLRLIGAEKHAELCEAAIGIYQRENPKQKKFKPIPRAVVEKNPLIMKTFDELEDMYYELDEIEGILASYIRIHVEKFASNQ